MKDSIIKALTTFAKVAGYVLVSWFISMPVQALIQDWIGQMVSDVTLVLLINSLLAAITSYLRGMYGEDNILKFT